MTPRVLDGKMLADKIEADLALRVNRLIDKSTALPCLATILVGDDQASATYVKMKRNACNRVGMISQKIVLPESTTTTLLLQTIDKLNRDENVSGILLQHPVPSQIDERACFDAIALAKDVDGVTCHGFGRMAMDEPAFGSATPIGIMRLLSHFDIVVKGKHAVVVGRSPILGKPLALMLLNAHATVTICHSKTVDLPTIVGLADIVVGAVGKPEFIKASWIKPGAVLVDAGYNPGPVGDIELSAAIPNCFAYTPVPGGVGPMTIVSLIEQTVVAAENKSSHADLLRNRENDR